MPLLVLSGEKAGGPFLIEQGKMVATNVEGVLVKGSGHWLMEEALGQVIPKRVEFLDRQSMIRTRRAALAQSGYRFSEKIMLKQEDGRRA
jgi:hypothetical protein